MRLQDLALSPPPHLSILGRKHHPENRACAVGLRAKPSQGTTWERQRRSCSISHLSSVYLRAFLPCTSFGEKRCEPSMIKPQDFCLYSTQPYS
ncbi:hypothetical protein DV515_00014437, partial [Chloebia gouldiae]